MFRRYASGGGQQRAMQPPPTGGRRLAAPRPLRISFVVIFSKAAARAQLAAIAATWIAFSAASAHAQSPPEGCRAASKIEYDSARRTYLLQNRFGRYVRTGRLWRRHYWYCHLS
jgi:hypothetical protein